MLSKMHTSNFYGRSQQFPYQFFSIRKRLFPYCVKIMKIDRNTGIGIAGIDNLTCIARVLYQFYQKCQNNSYSSQYKDPHDESMQIFELMAISILSRIFVRFRYWDENGYEIKHNEAICLNTTKSSYFIHKANVVQILFYYHSNV